MKYKHLFPSYREIKNALINNKEKSSEFEEYIFLKFKTLKEAFEFGKTFLEYTSQTTPTEDIPQYFLTKENTLLAIPAYYRDELKNFIEKHY